ncbi:MAG: D-amino-acid transaminase [Bacillota bacterium]
MCALAYINGVFCSPGEKQVCIEDRGYQFGDGVYEVIRAYGGHPFQLQAHLDRLWASAGAVGISINKSQPEMAGLVREILDRSRISEAQVYIQVSRGVAPRQHGFPPGIEPVLVMTVRPVPEAPSLLWEQGAAVITYPEIRWRYCYIKTINLLPNAMAKSEAVKAGVQEALFVREDGTVTEGSSTNVFMIKDKTVQTHPANERILHGITRGVVINICNAEKLKVIEKEFNLDQLLTADEVFITGTNTEVMPIVKVNGRKIGEGIPGPITGLLYESYKKFVQKEIFYG